MPDTLLFLGVPQLFKWLKDYQKRDNYRLIMHTYVGCSPLSKNLQEILNLSDILVVNSNFEKDIINNCIPELCVKVIPPGIDIELVSRSPYFQESPNVKCGVACVAQDIPLIDFPSLFKAFGIVSKENPDVAFGIFSDPSQLMRWNIPDMLDVYGLQDKLIINSRPEINFEFATLGDLYSSIDLMVLPNQEATVNVPSLESAYCGVPLILPDIGTTREYFSSPILLKKFDIFIDSPSNTRKYVFDAHEIAATILSFSEIRKSTKKNFDDKLDKCNMVNVMKLWSDILQ